MSIGRVLLILILLGAAAWLLKSHLAPASPEGTATAPVERARRLARRTEESNAQAESLKRETDSVPPGQITENMTPEQVRALLGEPSTIESETTETGVRREKWTYRSVSKTVTFENGIVVSVN